MRSQGSDDPTQELSPSHYEGIIDESRSRLHLPVEEQEPDLHREEEQDSEIEGDGDVTQNPGDEGHVDLMTSLESQNGAAHYEDEQEPEAASDEECEYQQEPPNGDAGGQEQEMEASNNRLGRREYTQEDSEPIEVDFSPTQSQVALSQYPESQRFKTPATAGKKRRYNGDIIESPELPRNSKPLLRGGDSNGLPMGLSQAFGATQANTSPFIGHMNGELHSDRPSPSINLQPRPTTADSSSPMKPLPTVERSARARTEPLDHYVSSNVSQARREEARRKELEQDAEDDDFEEDDFDLGEDSWIARDNRKRERDRKIQAQPPLSSPLTYSRRGLSVSKSSPIRGQRSSPIKKVKRAKFTVESSPPKEPQESQVTESEEETEQEDNAEIAVTVSSQSLLPVDEEDKENFVDRAVQIPETTIAFQRVIHNLPAQVQESPLVRHSRSFNQNQAPMVSNSSQAFAVANSQPERTLRRPHPVTQVPRSSAMDEGLDFVPQSPESSPRATAPVLRHPALVPQFSSTGENIAEQNRIAIDHTVPASSAGARHQPASTIPETSSNEPLAQNGKESGDRPQTGDTDSRGEFDTAQTHLQPSTTAAQPSDVAETSSQPVSTTPPGKRRKLAQIDAEPSPSKSQSSFDASQALRLDAQFVDSVHGTSILDRLTRKAAQGVAKGLGSSAVCNHAQEEAVALIPEQEVLRQFPQDGDGDRNDILAVEPSNNRAPQSTHPQRDRKPTAKGLSARDTKLRSGPPVSRASQFDLPVSPAKKSPVASKASAALKRKAALSDDAPASTSSKRLKSALSRAAARARPSANTKKPEDSPEPVALEKPAPSAGPVEPEVSLDDPGNESNDVLAPNMVFAVFNGNSRAYHPAVCLGRPDVHSERFKIQWEGYDPDIIDQYGVRRLDLRIGDQVKIDLKGFPKVSHIVRGFKDKIDPDNAKDKQMITDIHGFQNLLVAPKQRKSLPADISTDAVKKVPVSAVYLDSMMWGQMKDRVYEYKPALDSSFTSGRSTPAAQTTSSSPPSTPPSRSRRGTAANLPPTSSAIDLTEGIFSNMAFAISDVDDAKKEDLVRLIKNNGGIVLKDSFLDLFKPDCIQLKEKYARLTFAALLTDRHSRKKLKYLQALALGLPCLSGRWIEASVRAAQVADWSLYLLAAGECTELDGAIKSRILPSPLAMQGLKLEDIIALRAKSLANARVVVVTGKGKAQDKRMSFLSLIRALGPRQIDLEPDLDSSKATIHSAADSDEPVNYIFVDDRDVETAKELLWGIVEPEVEHKTRKKGKTKKARAADETNSDSKSEEVDSSKAKVKIMGNEDIVQSLILGRLWIGT